jgi:predicted dehydrogenase
VHRNAFVVFVIVDRTLGEIYSMTTTALRSDTTLLTLRIAMLGVGRWGSHLLRNFLQNPDVTIAAVIDPWIPNLKRSQDLFGPIAPPDTQWLTDWQVALDTFELDAIVVATPAETHYPVIRAALIKGLHVLAEKPLTLTVAESIELCELAEKNNVQLVVDHTYLFNPAIARARRSIENLGNLRYAYATRTHLAPVRQDVDALWDLAIHDIAILNYWLDDRPLRVSARGKRWLQRDIQTDLSPNGLADTIWATLEYSNGFCADLHFSWLNCDKQRRMAVVGDRGTMIFDELAPEQLIIHYGELVKTGQSFSPDRQTREVLPIAPQEPLKLLCEHFVHCIQTNESSKISSGWLGSDLVAVLVALSDSMNQNSVWISLDDRSHLQPHL